MPVREVVRKLKEAGLHSIPGGGGEILVDCVRNIIAPKKAMTDEWLGVMIDAAKEGLKGSCTMVIGHFETLAERIEHLERLRRAQDEHAPFSAFIVWTMQPKHTKLEGRRSLPARSITWHALCRAAVPRNIRTSSQAG
jgi:cyclic dehypoxanthinyl futalosine synthase